MQGPPEEDPEGIFDASSTSMLPTAPSHQRVHARVSHGLVNTIAETSLATTTDTHRDTADTLSGQLGASFVGFQQAMGSMFSGVHTEHVRLHTVRQRYSDALVPAIEQFRKTKLPKAAHGMQSRAHPFFFCLALQSHPLIVCLCVGRLQWGCKALAN